MTLLTFATKTADNAEYSGERLMNFYARPVDGGTAPGVLIGCRGLREVSGLTDAPVRALVARDGGLMAIAGGSGWLWDDGEVTDLGSLPDHIDSEIAIGGADAAFVAGGSYFASEDGGALSEIVPGILASARSVAYMDGYYIVSGSFGGRHDVLQVSSLFNPKQFDPLDYATAESHPDATRHVLADHGELLVFGERSMEPWVNTGGVFPFQRNTLSSSERGCTAGTPAAEDNGVFWVGDDGTVYRRGGAEPGVISTREVEEAIRADRIFSAFTFLDGGHKYCIRMRNTPAQVYDMATGLWHTRSSGLDGGPWVVTCAARIGSTQYFGTECGRIATFSDDYTEFGRTMPAEAVSTTVQAGRHFKISEVAAYFRDGETQPPPTVMLSKSYDGGRTWRTERRGAPGALGDYHRIIRWRGFGASRRVNFRLRITDDAPRDITGVHYE